MFVIAPALTPTLRNEMSGIPFFNKLEIRWFRLFGYGSFARPSFPYLKDGFDGVFFVVHQKRFIGEVDFGYEVEV
jgi:hypothetical protein